jgi:hypothetical protein
MYDPRGRMLSEEPPESVSKKRRNAVLLGIAVIALGAMPLVLADNVTAALLGFIMVAGMGVYIMYWSRIVTPTRVFEGGIEFFSGFGTRFVPYQEMGSYYEHNGLVVRYYPEVRMGGSSRTQYLIHLPTSMPSSHWIASYVKRMVDQNPDAFKSKVYVGTGPFGYRVK